jgi:uncharacterized protein (TIGR00255 family)
MSGASGKGKSSGGKDGEGVRSMTGFGRAAFDVEGLGFEIEIRTVNHRHLDVRLKLPRLLAEFETAVRARVPRLLGRGKVDFTVAPAGGVVADSELEIDQHVAEQYVSAAGELKDRFGLSGSLDVRTLLELPGVTRFKDAGLPPEVLERELMDAVDRALVALDAMRATEGRSLANDIESRLANIVGRVGGLGARSEIVRAAAKDRLRKRADQLELETGLLDEARLHQEIVIAADRLDISEELARLDSHIEQFRAVLGDAGRGHPVGRRLDFLLQELGRETNTVGSKANDAPIAHDVVEMKTELERIREQVQNIE